MACSWITNNTGEVIGALTEDGKKSKLFENLLKQYDAQQAHLIEKMGRDHTHEQAQAKMVFLDRERGGFSL